MSHLKTVINKKQMWNESHCFPVYCKRVKRGIAFTMCTFVLHVICSLLGSLSHYTQLISALYLKITYTKLIL